MTVPKDDTKNMRYWSQVRYFPIHCSTMALYLPSSYCLIQWLNLQILGAVGVSQVALSFGSQVAVAGVIIPKLQEEEDPRVRMTLEQGSWIRKRRAVILWQFDFTPLQKKKHYVF